VSTFDPRHLKDIFQCIDAEQTDAAVLDLRNQGVHTNCARCAERFLLLAEAVEYHAAVLRSRGPRRAAHYAVQRRERLEELGIRV
jgi:hypothetical protein